MVKDRQPRRNFCIRIRHNALSALEMFRLQLHNSKFRRYLIVATILAHNHPLRLPFIIMSIFYLTRARSIERKVWTTPVMLGERRKCLFIDWPAEICYQELNFEKVHLEAIQMV